MNRRHFPEMQNPVRRRNGGDENPQKLAESHAHSGDRAGLNHQEQRPPIKESPQRAERLAQVNVLSSGTRHHCGQFAVAQRPDDSHKASYQPGRNE